MLDDLKTQRTSGWGPRERTRLSILVGLCLVVGSVMWTSRGCSDQPLGTPLGELSVRPKSAGGRPLDLQAKPLVDLRAAGGERPTWDADAIDFLVGEVRSGTLSRESGKKMTVSEVLALDPKEAIGTFVEVRGKVVSLDAEEFESPTHQGVHRLWVFGLDDAEGHRIVVAHGATGNEPEGGRPEDEYKGDRCRIRDGDWIRVRGIYAMRRGGTVGSLPLDGPTPVLVGRAYRRSPGTKPAPATLAEIDWTKVRDRYRGETRTVEDPTHYQALQWVAAQGHAKLVEEIRAKRLATEEWGQQASLGFTHDVQEDAKTEPDPETGEDAPDARRWLMAQRGKAFWTTGVFGRMDEEDWSLVPPNEFDVGTRWNLFLGSDWHGNVALRFDSPFGIEEFPGVSGKKNQRLKVYGVYTRNYTYGAQVVDKGKRGKDYEVTVPCFVLLHVEPYNPFAPQPIWRSFFFWVTVSLVLLGLLFYLVLIRGEKKESSVMEARKIALRKRIRASEAAKHGEGLPFSAPPSEGGPPPPPDANAPPPGP